MEKLTKEQSVVIGAYSGILCGKFSDLHEYVEKIMGRSILTHEFADAETVKQIKDAAKPDFIKLCGLE